MEFTDTDLRKFQGLYRKHFGMELDRDTAYRKLSLLVRQMEIAYRPITKAQVATLKDVHGDENAKPETQLQQ